jgi:hypothetical protein
MAILVRHDHDKRGEGKSHIRVTKVCVRGICRDGECDKAPTYDSNIGLLHYRSGNLGNRCRSLMAREQSQKCDSKTCRPAREQKEPFPIGEA